MRLDTKKGRAELAPRAAPYYAKIAIGQSIGYRKTPDGSETWNARFRDEDGKQHYTSLGPVTDAFNYDQALEAANKWFRQLAEGVTGKTADGDAVTVATACREYTEQRRRQKGQESASYVARFFERRVYGREKGPRRPAVAADPIASIRLDKLRKRDVEAFRDRLVKARHRGKPRDRATVNREMTDLNAALNLAVSNRLVSETRQREWTDVKAFPNAENRRDLYLDIDQRRALLVACQGAVRDLVEAATLTGARAGELTRARVSQFDPRTASITFKGKTGTRTVPLSPAAAALFKRAARAKLPKAFLLTNDDGKPWGHSGWDDLIREAAKKAQLPTGTCLYTLRHSFITQALTGGMPTLDVARIAGTGLRMIEKHYGHLVTAGARERLALVEML